MSSIPCSKSLPQQLLDLIHLADPPAHPMGWQWQNPPSLQILFSGGETEALENEMSLFNHSQGIAGKGRM